MTDLQPAISVRNVSKTFAGRQVLRNANLDVLPGEVHGLLGQNGSGKSTLIKVLAGYHEPDPGASLVVRGTPVSLPLSPDAPRRLGMSFVHQDLALIESASVLENVRTGYYESGWGWRISWRKERRIVEQALARLGVRLSPDALISSLKPVDRAMVAIARALEHLRGVDNGVLVLDEPTPYLPRSDVDRLFATIRDVAATGVGVLFVSHRLEEVRALTNRVTILRDGEIVESAPTASLTESDLIQRILGFSLDTLYPATVEAQEQVILSARDLSGGRVSDLALTLRRGEVIGMTGLLGMGWEDVPYLLYGATGARTGSITIENRVYDARSLTPRRAIRAGLALVPGNRLGDGALAGATVAENVTLPTLMRYFRHGSLRRGREISSVSVLLNAFDVRPPDPTLPFRTFSGGNQQKAVLAKWFETHPKVLLLHEPTQGVDIGAKSHIFQRVHDVAEGGTAVIIASAEYEDLAHLCDRVIVFRDGVPVSELSGSSLTQERIVEQSFREARRTATAPSGSDA